MGVIGAANAAVGMTFKSVQDATSTRDLLADQLDKLMETTTDDNLYAALQEMRSQVVKAVPGEDQSLAQVSELTIPSTMPSITLAYDLYGSLDGEQDLIDRNGIRHPGFVQGGKPLEVLSSG
jgi:prophage DNA circulation protein